MKRLLFTILMLLAIPVEASAISINDVSFYMPGQYEEMDVNTTENRIMYTDYDSNDELYYAFYHYVRDEKSDYLISEFNIEEFAEEFIRESEEFDEIIDYEIISTSSFKNVALVKAYSTNNKRYIYTYVIIGGDSITNFLVLVDNKEMFNEEEIDLILDSIEIEGYIPIDSTEFISSWISYHTLNIIFLILGFVVLTLTVNTSDLLFKSSFGNTAISILGDTLIKPVYIVIAVLMILVSFLGLF